jgi:CSLREA domain-containing protein
VPHRPFGRLTSIMFLALVLVYSQSAWAKTLIVTKTTDTNDGICDQDCSLREAIIAANRSSETDIIFLLPGTYTLSIKNSGPDDEDNAATGDLDIRSTMFIMGTDARTTIIDGGGLDRIFHLVKPSTPGGVILVYFANLTIQHGITPIDPATSQRRNGGGILNDGNSIQLRNCILSLNHGGDGGGIFQTANGSVSIENSTISLNRADSNGGAIYSQDLHAHVNIDKSSIRLNDAGNNGGGLYILGGIVVITDSTISNQGGATFSDINNGGGLYNVLGRVEISRSTIVGNSAQKGSAVANFTKTALQIIDFDDLPNGTAVIDQYKPVIFSGARILTPGMSTSPASGTNVLTNSSPSANDMIEAVFDQTAAPVHTISAKITGDVNITMSAYNAQGAILGAVAQTGGSNVENPNKLLSVTSTRDAIAKVIIKRGQGSRTLIFTVDDFTYSYDTSGSVTIRSSILGNENQNCSGTVASQGENLVSDTTCGKVSSDILGTSGATFTDPGIPGWGHWTLPLGSPAIGKSHDCPGVDQLGQPRFQGRQWEPHTATCDIGAVEFIPVVNPYLTFDPNPNTYTFTNDASGCPVGYAGIFSFDALLTNKNDSGHWLTDLLVHVNTLTANVVCLSGEPCGNLLQTGHGLGGRGSRQVVNLKDGYIEGWLAPGDSVKVPFTICLQNTQNFAFFVDILGTDIPQDPTTLCYGVTFNRATECCASGSVIGKHEITIYNRDMCTERVADPAWVASEHVNGCGPADPSFPEQFVPENPNVIFGGPSFTPACNKHDECYGTFGADRDRCDGQFFSDLRKLCSDASIHDDVLDKQKYDECFGNARTYYSFVHKYGGIAYRNAQTEASQCCP